MEEISHRTIKAGEVSLHIAEAGVGNSEPVILLHGFPDASFGWEKQMSALASAGFYVVAPDQRGYNLSEKPSGVHNYQVKKLVADILALADELNLPRFYLAGHDWGALVCWNLVTNYPQRVKRLAILNVPHPAVMNEFLKTNWQQRMRSWYAFFFQLPVLPEVILGAFNWSMLANTMRHSFNEAELNRYRSAWSQPGAMTAMINWYRGLFQQPPKSAPVQKISVPTLMIWGKLDPHLMWQMAPDSIARCENGRLEFIEDATHWVHQEKPQHVNRLLIEHFSAETGL